MTFEVILSPKSGKQIETFDEKLKERIKIATIRNFMLLTKYRKEVLIVKIERRDENTYKLNFLRNYKFSIFPPITNIPSLT
jgi:hypothetical protein